MKIRVNSQGARRSAGRPQAGTASSRRPTKTNPRATSATGRRTSRNTGVYGNLVGRPPSQKTIPVWLIVLGGIAALIVLIIIGAYVSDQMAATTAPAQETTSRPNQAPRPTSWRDEKAKPLPELGGLTMAEYMKKHGLDKNQMLQERKKRQAQHRQVNQE